MGFLEAWTGLLMTLGQPKKALVPMAAPERSDERPAHRHTQG
jgi:hypothetical protein